MLLAEGNNSCSNPLRQQLRVQQRHARNVAAVPVEARDKPLFDRVGRRQEHDWNRGCRRLGRACGGVGRRDEDRDAAGNQLGR